MGDRRIAVLEFPDDYGADLGIYTHWGGEGMENSIRGIVASDHFQGRKGDEAYAARIIVDQVTKPSRDEEDGYGLFPVPKGADPTHYAESEYDVIYVDLQTGHIRLVPVE